MTLLLALGLVVAVVSCGDEGGQATPADTQQSDTSVPNDTSTPPTDIENDLKILPDTTPSGPVIGAACTRDGGECAGICASTLPAGYCTAACDTAACPAGSECRTINDFPFCMDQCASDADCRQADGYRCLAGACDIACQSLFDCQAGEQCTGGLCVEPPPDRAVGSPCTTSKQCISGYCLAPGDGGVCGEPCVSGSCNTTGWSCRGLIPEGGTAALSLCGPGGQFTSEEVALTGANPKTFTVGTDVVSFMIIAEANSPYSWAYMENLRRPDGSMAAGVMNNEGFTAPFRMSPNTGHASAMFPNNANPALQVEPGQWSIDIYAGQGIKQARVFYKRAVASGEVLSTTFDLNVFIASGALAGLSASTAPGNAHIKGALDRVRDSYWTRHGIHIDTITFHDLPSSYANVADEAELNEMWSTYSGTVSPGAINIFLVRDLLNGKAAGISGGVPGPIGVSGVGGGGVAVQIQDWAAATGDNITHEVGHFLGFYHVTEIYQRPDGSLIHDVIEDTTQCNTSPGNMWNYHPCMDNIMFPVLLTGTGVTQSLSGTQGGVARLNPRGR